MVTSNSNTFVHYHVRLTCPSLSAEAQSHEMRLRSLLSLEGVDGLESNRSSALTEYGGEQVSNVTLTDYGGEQVSNVTLTEYGGEQVSNVTWVMSPSHNMEMNK